MTSSAASVCLLLKLIPALRNPRYRRTYLDARDNCLRRALAGEAIDVVPLYSHNVTYQSFYRQGWQSVTEQDIRLAKTVGMSAEVAREKIEKLFREPHAH
ncbi:hypothetical protein [Yersinia alsatica]|uniref:hypothetical protein n=1 Tax=Yersinia alsatica TaxID=2890317 RepID=UPI000B665107|nr:hypothetical protein [Yersinia alsatica]OWF79048.1 hypothetical protein B4900_11545 [Yersinia rohdei]